MFDSLTKKITGVFSRIAKKGRLNENDIKEMLREVRVALLEADVNYKVAKDFIERIKEKAVGSEIFSSLTADQTLIKIVRDELIELLGTSETRFNWSSAPPTVVLMCGLQGSGKTTATAKLASWFLKQGKKPMLAACDTQRPAAIKQLEILGEQISVPVFSKHDASSPLQIAKEALEKCRYLMHDVLIIDTAGRLNIDQELMKELEEIQAVTKPTEVMLVLDATTGQEAVHVASEFHNRFQTTGVIFTKLDGDTRGGAVLSVRAALGIPVRFIGIGEQINALDVFYPKRMAERILGMGDVLGLIETVEQAVSAEDTQALEKKLKSGQFDLNDMLMQIRTIRKMGPLKNVMKMLPGIGNFASEKDLDGIDEQKFHQIESIILSMTPKERSNVDILNSSRRKRIASGSGRSVSEINVLIKQVQEMRKNMKMFSKIGKKYQKFGKWH